MLVHSSLFRALAAMRRSHGVQRLSREAIVFLLWLGAAGAAPSPPEAPAEFRSSFQAASALGSHKAISWSYDSAHSSDIKKATNWTGTAALCAIISSEM